MVKRIISTETLTDLKILKMESIIKKLTIDIPLEGSKWQAGMLRHYTNQLENLKKVRDGLRRSK
ncbi:hypothetical protein CMI37_19685 [Candidatus Pacearchaeota archaeon]|nr:hypothetical protein [Candidatus Pacearchaeota archaeon]|tara:strand:- start:148 stop:339 length:192 start_codon:yes stop_codon:yes gene_type:complete